MRIIARNLSWKRTKSKESKQDAIKISITSTDV